MLDPKDFSLYSNKKKIPKTISQQQTNFADVTYLDWDLIGMWLGKETQLCNSPHRKQRQIWSHRRGFLFHSGEINIL